MRDVLLIVTGRSVRRFDIVSLLARLAEANEIKPARILVAPQGVDAIFVEDCPKLTVTEVLDAENNAPLVSATPDPEIRMWRILPNLDVYAHPIRVYVPKDIAVIVITNDAGILDRLRERHPDRNALLTLLLHERNAVPTQRALCLHPEADTLLSFVALLKVFVADSRPR